MLNNARSSWQQGGFRKYQDNPRGKPQICSTVTANIGVLRLHFVGSCMLKRSVPEKVTKVWLCPLDFTMACGRAALLEVTAGTVQQVRRHGITTPPVRYLYSAGGCRFLVIGRRPLVTLASH